MKQLFKKYSLTTLAIYLTTQIISSFTVSGSWQTFLYATLVLSILFYLLKPLLNVLLFPLNLLTLNLTSWLFTVIIFFLWTVIIPEINISSWQFPGLALGPISLSSYSLSRWQVIIAAGILVNLILRSIDWLFE